MNHKERSQLRPFDGVANFRDAGGFGTEDGRMMKKGMLYRSDDLCKLSQHDIARIEQLGIKLIVDLRTPNECKSKPSRIPKQSGIETIHASMQHESQTYSRSEFFRLLTQKPKELDFAAIMKDVYQKMAHDRKQQIQQIITALSDEKNYPAIIHCTSGKDRTGFVAATLQLLAGVPYQTVMEDYLLSNEHIGPRAKKMEQAIRWISLFRITSEQMKPLFEVRYDFLDDVLQDVLRTHGSIEEYLCQACEIDRSKVVRLRELLTE
ncbi:tyrosine-protein phosphatase [Brevibacillus dissolubilis]|uniref:tyrosine-protein phosphatase n=1 Tax=Brevibacillus dissolubilis TaxID=1844116 RepID=UPI00111689C6|nr:tyrosine-protein phosphatase [Brevibacillus dissolubilis]